MKYEDFAFNYSSERLLEGVQEHRRIVNQTKCIWENRGILPHIMQPRNAGPVNRTKASKTTIIKVAKEGKVAEW